MKQTPEQALEEIRGLLNLPDSDSPGSVIRAVIDHIEALGHNANRFRHERDHLARAVIGEQDYVWAGANQGAEGVPGYADAYAEYRAALANAAEMHRLLVLRADRLAATTSNEATTDA